MLLLFVYGTLRSDCCTDAIRGLRASLASLGQATLPGALYDLGDYPGLVVGGIASLVRGELLACDDPAISAEIWNRLDRYEGCRADGQGLYRRVRSVATLDRDGSMHDCWVYVYNGPLSTAPLIESGCWRSHSRRQPPSKPQDQ